MDTRLSGRVRDARGDPVGDARIAVTAAPRPMPDIAQLSDASGGFVLLLPAAGRYTLQVNADGYAPATVHVQARAGTARREPLEVVLRQA